ncbi:MAG: hypothetical protein JW953_02095 [Anaerolineae bacterium]|nr:hypothetical protein [Anaerolineae bacterium]
MMPRKELGKMNGERARFYGTFERFGKKRGWKGREETTILLTNVCLVDTDNIVTEHLWFNLTKSFAALDLQPGDIVEFDARVKSYMKGYFGHREEVYRPYERDYKLSHPTKAKKRVSG